MGPSFGSQDVWGVSCIFGLGLAGVILGLVLGLGLV